MLSAGLLLVAGAVAGLWAAATPSLTRVWSAPLPDKLLMIADRRGAWWRANVLFLVAIMATAGGLATLAALIREGGSYGPAFAGLGLTLAATPLWAVDLAFRVTVTTSVAEAVKGGAAVPTWYPSAAKWSWSLLIIYSLCASAALVGFGLGIVRSGILPEWSGWIAMAGVGVLIFGTIARKDTIPVVVQLLTLLFGVLLLIAEF